MCKGESHFAGILLADRSSTTSEPITVNSININSGKRKANSQLPNAYIYQLTCLAHLVRRGVAF